MQYFRKFPAVASPHPAMNPVVMHRKTILIPACLLAAGGLAILLWWLVGSPQRSPAQRQTPNEAPSSRQAAAPAAGPIAVACGLLHEKPERAATLRALMDLRAALMGMPRHEAVARIRSFLASGLDHNTGIAFEIGPGGVLTGWPTLRSFLLDQLLAIDPAAAAALSRGILNTPTTADEWALALRNVGTVEAPAEANAYLRERTEALIANPSWQAHPSVGYLNAFDVLVHTHATASTPLLSGLIQQKDRGDLSHAAFLTLDRLVQSDSPAVLSQLATDRSLHQSRPEMVAQEFARADLRDPAQSALVRAWLLDPARTAADLNSFAAVYPNNNRFVSNNLLTADVPFAGADLAKHDREALEIIKSWVTDPAFQPIAGQLNTMVARLSGFVGTQPQAPSPRRVE